MSTYFNDIQAALDIRLSTITGSPTILWPLVPGLPNATDNYLRPTFLPGESVQVTLGDTGKDFTTGLYQVDVFERRGTGRSSQPDVIGDHFKRGTYLTYNGITVRIMSVSIRATQTDENHTFTPVVIRWEVYTPPRS
jgi:hypothetical protein